MKIQKFNLHADNFWDDPEDVESIRINLPLGAHIDIKQEGGSIKLMGHGDRLSGALSISPQVANMIIVEVKS